MTPFQPTDVRKEEAASPLTRVSGRSVQAGPPLPMECNPMEAPAVGWGAAAGERSGEGSDGGKRVMGVPNNLPGGSDVKK